MRYNYGYVILNLFHTLTFQSPLCIYKTHVPTSYMRIFLLAVIVFSVDPMPPKFCYVGWHIIAQFLASIGFFVNPIIYVLTSEFARTAFQKSFNFGCIKKEIKYSDIYLQFGTRPPSILVPRSSNQIQEHDLELGNTQNNPTRENSTTQDTPNQQFQCLTWPRRLTQNKEENH